MSSKDKILYNKPLGIAVFCAILLISLFVGCKIGFSREYNRLSEIFESGSGGADSGITHDVKTALASSYDLMTIASRSLPANSPKIEAVREVRDRVNKDNGIAAMADEFYRLYEVTADLYSAVRDTLDGADLTQAKIAWGDFASCYETVKNSTYNTAAADYNRRRDSFPASLFAPLLSIPTAELFE